MSCKGNCQYFENGYSGNPKYSLGYRYCAVCEFSISTEEIICPCCNSSLRLKARHKTGDFNEIQI